MPYLTETDFNAPSGELNRALTKVYVNVNFAFWEREIWHIVEKYVHDQKPRYATFNDVIGALECSMMEYYRRNPEADSLLWEIINDVKRDFYKQTVAPYEDKKIEEHGDVYESVQGV